MKPINLYNIPTKFQIDSNDSCHNHRNSCNCCTCCNSCNCCNCCPNVCCKKNVCKCDIIKSIAKMENSLARILNAEGEKLQKAIEISDNICDLLKINRSVRDTIENITELETVLFKKLRLVVPSKCLEDKDDFDCCID